MRFPGGEVVDVDVGVAVDVGLPQNGLAVGGELAAVDFPFVMGEPVDFLGGDVEQSHIGVTVGGVGGDEQALAVEGEVVHPVVFLAGVLGDFDRLRGFHIGNKYIGVFPGGVVLRIGDQLTIVRPHRAAIAQLRRRSGGQMADLAVGYVEDINLPG